MEGLLLRSLTWKQSLGSAQRRGHHQRHHLHHHVRDLRPGQLLLIHNVPDAVGVLLASVAHNKYLLLAMFLALAVLAVVPQISLLLRN